MNTFWSYNYINSTIIISIQQYLIVRKKLEKTQIAMIKIWKTEVQKISVKSFFKIMNAEISILISMLIQMSMDAIFYLASQTTLLNKFKMAWPLLLSDFCFDSFLMMDIILSTFLFDLFMLMDSIFYFTKIWKYRFFTKYFFEIYIRCHSRKLLFV